MQEVCQWQTSKMTGAQKGPRNVPKRGCKGTGRDSALFIPFITSPVRIDFFRFEEFVFIHVSGRLFDGVIYENCIKFAEIIFYIMLYVAIMVNSYFTMLIFYVWGNRVQLPTIIIYDKYIFIEDIFVVRFCKWNAINIC